jgi:uncharacterized membrane protein (UPF0182 family)
MTREEMIRTLGADVCCGNYIFIIGDKNGVLYLQAHYPEPDVYASEKPNMQHTRKWMLSEHMTRSELVQTALKCVLTSAEHRVREQFTYKGKRIYGPHLDCEVLVKIAGATDVREPEMAGGAV